MPHVTPVLNFTSFHRKTKDYTIIQLLFATTLFRELPEINSVAVTNFRDQSLFATVNNTKSQFEMCDKELPIHKLIIRNE